MPNFLNLKPQKIILFNSDSFDFHYTFIQVWSNFEGESDTVPPGWRVGGGGGGGRSSGGSRPSQGGSPAHNQCTQGKIAISIIFLLSIWKVKIISYIKNILTTMVFMVTSSNENEGEWCVSYKVPSWIFFRLMALFLKYIYSP